MASAKTAAPEVKFSNLEKVFFPKTRFTKGNMIQYYVAVAPYILPHLRRRPVTLIRFPDGVTGERFYEKNAPHFTPDWIHRAPVARRHHAGEIDYLVIDDARTLAWCANLAAIELHPFLHRFPQIDRPTAVAFDLDPGEGADLATCARVALLVREVLDGLKLQAFPKVSGSKGLQLYVPLNTATTYEITGAFAKAVAELLEKQHPKLVVSKMAKVLRRGRVMIDWSQNNPSKTTVCVYSMRGKRDAPFISMPLTWEEVGELARAKKRKPGAFDFTPAEALVRLKKRGDLFAPVLTLKQKLPAAFARPAVREAGRSQGVDAGGGGDREGRGLPAAVRSKGGRTVPVSRGDVGAAGTARRPGGRRSNGKQARGRGLEAYAAKRDFTQTNEPAPPARGKSAAVASTAERDKGKGKVTGRFVIQKHAATRLHYDFRLEMDGTLKSWAVPKGVPTELGVKHAAFEVEDHPISYLKFEGTIPKGQYGGGTVMVWDIGTFELLGGSHESGDLKLLLKGSKLKGEWHLFHIRSEDDKPVWLIMKSKVAAPAISARRDDMSALTRRSMARIAKDNDRQWQSK
jgi:bifunctional non-homologous end joining protein LigD